MRCLLSGLDVAVSPHPLGRRSEHGFEFSEPVVQTEERRNGRSETEREQEGGEGRKSAVKLHQGLDIDLPVRFPSLTPWQIQKKCQGPSFTQSEVVNEVAIISKLVPNATARVMSFQTAVHGSVSSQNKP